MSLDYVTRREKNGAALQVCQISGKRYLRIVRASDGKIAARWSSAPFAGKLRDAYAAFEAAMHRPMPEGDTFSPDDMAFGESLGRILHLDGEFSGARYQVRT